MTKVVPLSFPMLIEGFLRTISALFGFSIISCVSDDFAWPLCYLNWHGAKYRLLRRTYLAVFKGLNDS